MTPTEKAVVCDILWDVRLLIDKRLDGEGSFTEERLANINTPVERINAAARLIRQARKIVCGRIASGGPDCACGHTPHEHDGDARISHHCNECVCPWYTPNKAAR